MIKRVRGRMFGERRWGVNWYATGFLLTVGFAAWLESPALAALLVLFWVGFLARELSRR